MISQAVTMLIVGRKWVTGLSRNNAPASVVTAPASIARNLVWSRSVAANISTMPAASSSDADRRARP